MYMQIRDIGKGYYSIALDVDDITIELGTYNLGDLVILQDDLTDIISEVADTIRTIVFKGKNAN